MPHFKQQILKDVEIAITNNINRNTKNESVSRKIFMKNYIVSCLQSHIDTLLSEIYFLRKEVKEKNQLIKAVFRNKDIMP